MGHCFLELIDFKKEFEIDSASEYLVLSKQKLKERIEKKNAFAEYDSIFLSDRF